MKQHEIAEQFAHMADLLEYRGDNPFRVRAYRRAAQTLEQLPGDLAAMAVEQKLRSIPGIGEDLAQKIQEYLVTGSLAALERLKAQVPPVVPELLNIPGIGPKTAKVLTDKLRLKTVEDLAAAARAHKLQKLPGFQAKKEENILKALALVQQGQERMDLWTAWCLGQELTTWLDQVPGVTRTSIAGSLRRMRETVGDLDVLAAAKQPARVIERFRTSPFAGRVLAAGGTKASVITPQGVQVDLRVVAPESFGAALQYFTGSKEHNVRLREQASRQGLKINEYGVFQVKTGKRIAGREEADIYKALGLPWMAPELREDSGELDAAAAGTLPKLVDMKDIRGDFHVHTNASDGRDTFEVMARAGKEQGYDYLALCEHSPSLRIANGLSVPRLRERLNAIKAFNARSKSYRLLAGAEVDILADGKMDYPDSVLAELDFVVGSIHSGFTQPEAQITKRLIAAMRNPYVTIIGHPTGRLLGQRPPYAMDVAAVLKEAKDTGTALEMNAAPQRLDLTDTMARQARQAGVMLAICTDSHSKEQLGYMTLGVGRARRAWLQSSDLLNCMTLKRLTTWINRKRQRAST
ncbi:MAG: DNA polymerase III [Candidatus Omnitrophica bacterium CG11_big_fil_rev_8_21_14_0_20_63_9]|nr:MAG: DNA polymerase III [Candidatus Omnitrophica bacterium CG11_big_fil_rev_8_21_14_0_20_63_9]